MKNSKERLNYITEYILSYESTIKKYNKLGLFDEAKMFETFALEVCKIYFNCEFKDLNFGRNNFPCVDLVSTDGRVYIQVSTCEDIPLKIRNSLNDIKDSKDEMIRNISSIYFFVLNNDSICNVKDYCGRNKIGNLDFRKSKNLITTDDILKKAKYDLLFQRKLYEICRNDELPNYQNFNEALEESKILIREICDTIGEKYTINIDDLIDEIEKRDSKFILITGAAGTGKSVLCKKFVERNDNFLYTKAEKILEVSNVNDIWDFDISVVLNSVANNFFVFIDSLEFIAGSRTKLDLLNCLFDRLDKIQNIKVICSCRENDRSSFIHIENRYNFAIHKMKDISGKELEKMSNYFQVIKEMLNVRKYKDLLSNPFYLNCLTIIKDITHINNENDLRNIIWNKIMCLNDTDNGKIITSIVLDKSKNSLLGSDKSKYPSLKINKLISNNVLTEYNDKLRLKFDIFEDICFERYIDYLFDSSKGNYKNFFKKMESIGRCVYRRLQIWIENKLFAKNNRKNFYILF